MCEETQQIQMLLRRTPELTDYYTDKYLQYVNHQKCPPEKLSVLAS